MLKWVAAAAVFSAHILARWGPKWRGVAAMFRLLVALALILMVSALAVMFVPLYLPPPPRTAQPELALNLSDLQILLMKVRDIAALIQPPLSVAVSLLTLYYARRRSLVGEKNNRR